MLSKWNKEDWYLRLIWISGKSDDSTEGLNNKPGYEVIPENFPKLEKRMLHTISKAYRTSNRHIQKITFTWHIIVEIP